MVGRQPTVNRGCSKFMPVARALQIIGGSISQKLNVFYLGRAFKDIGFERVVRNHIRGYIVVQRSADEIRSRQKMLGGVEGTVGTEGTVVF